MAWIEVVHILSPGAKVLLDRSFHSFPELNAKYPFLEFALDLKHWEHQQLVASSEGNECISARLTTTASVSSYDLTTTQTFTS
jgi:hypothetical protein